MNADFAAKLEEIAGRVTFGDQNTALFREIKRAMLAAEFNQTCTARGYGHHYEVLPENVALWTVT